MPFETLSETYEFIIPDFPDQWLPLTYLYDPDLPLFPVQYFHILDPDLPSDQRPGDVRFVDQNQDGEINEADKKMIGNPNPDFELGLQLNAEYKGFMQMLRWQVNMECK